MTFELSGRDVTGFIWLYLALSFGLLGYLVGWLLELRRRERWQAEREQEQQQRIDALADRVRDVEKLASLGQLAAVVAHEVRNPLAVASGRRWRATAAARPRQPRSWGSTGRRSIAG